MRYIIYLGSIALLYALYFLLSSLHIGRVEKIKDDNEKFYLMQMELIRRQLDPHFLFNAQNSISFSINKDERKTAYYNLGLFSKFLRESIITLDDFSRSLEEEIDYVKNYLTLEKFRFKEKFDYDFIISPGVNKAQKVPKLILFSFIESALKKGVLPKSSGGRIEITIDNYLGKGIYILISDTGMHRNIGTSEESHTTNMLMMKRIVSYFNTFNAKKIEIYLKDTGSVEDPKGSTAEITIPPDYKYIV
jgi:LytS/YehU family sensor histidine kinase